MPATERLVTVPMGDRTVQCRVRPMFDNRWPQLNTHVTVLRADGRVWLVFQLKIADPSVADLAAEIAYSVRARGATS